MDHKLFIASGVSGGEVLPLTEAQTVLGRDPTCAVVIPDVRMSRRHCIIRVHEGAFFIEDLKSTNGTFVNGRSITRTQLADNDKIVLGSSVIYFGSERPANLSSRGRVMVVDEPPGPHHTYEVSADDVREGLADDLLEHNPPSSRERAAECLLTIYSLGQAIHAIHDTPELLEKVIDVVFEVIRADRGYIALADPQTGELTPVTFRTREVESGNAGVSISGSILKKVMEEKKGVLSDDAMSDERFRESESVLLQHVRSVLCVPLSGTTRTMGLIYVDTSRAACAFTVEDLRLVTAIGLQAGIALENVHLFEEKRELLIGALRALVTTLELRDPHTSGHAERVSGYSMAICEALGVDSDQRQEIELSCLLHDVGKIAVPDSILKKRGELGPSEVAVIEQHAAQGASILARIKGTEGLVLGVRHHHERYDGTGYPDGIAGEEICLAARMLAVADAFDAMHSERPYRDALPLPVALQRLEEGAGTQFDPALVQVFVKAVTTGAVRLVQPDARALSTTM